MLSKLAVTQGLKFSVLKNGRYDFRLCLSVARFSSSAPEKPVVPAPKAPEAKHELAKTLENWDNANKLFYGPQRDLKNFPVIKLPETCPPTRLGFIPETWFQALYEKTGVTGPYVFGFGLTTYLLSKEIVMFEHQLAHFIAFWMAFYWLYRKFGDKVAKALDKRTEALDEKMFLKSMRETRENCQAVIADLEKSIWQEGGQKYLFDAKRENIDLQLESVYRQRLAEVHQNVKRRLDYHLEVENLHKSLEQKHMVNWIVSNVIKSITPQQEKDSMLKCISDLKTLAQKSKAAPAV